MYSVVKRGLPIAALLIAFVFSGIGQIQAQEKKAAGSEAMAGAILAEDRVEGSADAPVTIVEYSSFTCPHCASFHTDVYPGLKKKYIDTGKVKIIFRAFPLDPLAAAASMLAQCVEKDNFFPFIDVLFKQQKNWAYSQSPVESLRKISLQAGLSSDSFESCLKNQKLLDSILRVKDKAAKELKINSTPTFEVNGEVVRGSMPLKEFEKLIEAKLRG